MTREEAKGSLIAIKNKYLANYGEDSIINILIDEYDIQAIDMAIKALEQEPCEDAISREDVLENAFKIYTHECGLLEVVGVATIKTLPSVKPQTGHWIIMGDRYIKCSECGHITKTESPDIYHFCMVCGANMSEEPTSSESEV